ncbi:hypothetical protein PN456_03355, partial [Nodularia spumigena CS-586/05]|uniref:hypothetical protein n=1 Tax=Nodularia spumigena TaxID=70799 RepID=UPI00233143DC
MGNFYSGIFPWLAFLRKMRGSLQFFTYAGEVANIGFCIWGFCWVCLCSSQPTGYVRFLPYSPLPTPH